MISGARSSSSSPSSSLRVGQRCNNNNNSISSTNSGSINKQNSRNRRDSNSCPRNHIKIERKFTKPTHGQDDTDSSGSMGPTIRGEGKKRDMANKRERERTKSLNKALEILRDRLPVPEAEKRSKIQTLRMAREYIIFLRRLSQSHDHHHQHEYKDSQLSSSQGQHLYQHPSFIQSPELIDDKDDTELGESATPDNKLIASKGHREGQQPPIPDSLTYKFYKFRLQSQTNKSGDHIQ